MACAAGPVVAEASDRQTVHQSATSTISRGYGRDCRQAMRAEFMALQLTALRLPVYRGRGGTAVCLTCTGARKTPVSVDHFAILADRHDLHQLRAAPVVRAEAHDVATQIEF